MAPLPTHITMRAYTGPFNALRSQICEELYFISYSYSSPVGVGKTETISQISLNISRISPSEAALRLCSRLRVTVHTQRDASGAQGRLTVLHCC